jgi:hypothetical protein
MKFSVLTIVLLAATMVACKKDPVTTQPGPNPARKIKLLLNDYVSVDKIDSALVNWNLNGAGHRLKLMPDAYDMSASIADLVAGNGKLTIQIFSKNKLDNKSLQYERVVNLGLQPDTAVIVTGPNLFEDLNWNPRIIFNHRGPYAMMKVTAVVGIRPNDPYFELIDINAAWRSRIVVERAYYDTADLTTPVAVGTWDCQQGCTDSSGNYKNETFFSFLPQQIGNRIWQRAQFFIRFYNTPMSAGELNFDHNF